MHFDAAIERLVHRARRSSALVRALPGEGRFGPTLLVVLIALFQLAVWGALSGLLAIAPPDDSLEQVLLSQELRFEYGKHPPLPTWILFGFNQIFGASIGSTYVLGALCSVATMLLLYRFARPLVGDRRAALAAILLTNVEYMNVGTAYFNHNTVQLPLALLAIMLFHRALTRMRWQDWVTLGLGCGAMMLAKFSAVILFASFAVYLLWTERLREPRIWKGIAIAAPVGIAVIIPYLLAVRNDPWSPNAYAMNSVFPADVDRLQCLKTVWGFVSSQFAKVAPALLVFAVVRKGASRMGVEDGRGVDLGSFLTTVGFGPLVLTILIAATSGAHLLVGWGTTFHVLLTFWLVVAHRTAIEVQPHQLQRAALASIVVQIALWSLATTHGGRLPNLNPTPHQAAPPIPAALAEVVRGIWTQHCSAPLRFVVTDGHTGAALAVRYQGKPRVVDAMRAEFSKFFPDDARLGDGAVVVSSRPTVNSASTAAQTPLDKLIAHAAWQTSVELAASDGRQYQYKLGILSPVTGEGCESSQ